MCVACAWQAGAGCRCGLYKMLVADSGSTQAQQAGVAGRRSRQSQAHHGMEHVPHGSTAAAQQHSIRKARHLLHTPAPPCTVTPPLTSRHSAVWYTAQLQHHTLRPAAAPLSQASSSPLQVAATVEKEAGNAAFSAKRYEEAIKHFTKCIQLDPG
jgi:hypothetical protein